MRDRKNIEEEFTEATKNSPNIDNQEDTILHSYLEVLLDIRGLLTAEPKNEETSTVKANGLWNLAHPEDTVPTEPKEKIEELRPTENSAMHMQNISNKLNEVIAAVNSR